MTDYDKPKPDKHEIIEGEKGESEMSEKAEVVRDRLNPNDWRVEKIGRDGDVEVAVFSGPRARERAQRFADCCYGPGRA